jgi:hypothetical protein
MIQEIDPNWAENALLEAKRAEDPQNPRVFNMTADLLIHEAKKLGATAETAARALGLDVEFVAPLFSAPVEWLALAVGDEDAKELARLDAERGSTTLGRLFAAMRRERPGDAGDAYAYLLFLARGEASL